MPATWKGALHAHRHSLGQTLRRERQAAAVTEWIFPSPLHLEEPVSPSSVYNRLKKILRDAKLPDLRFHDLRHTFATTALEHGLDIKTLSTIIGHVSSATTIDVYSHITEPMQLRAAEKIEQGIGQGEVRPIPTADPAPQTPQRQTFTPAKGKIRKSGTGGIYKINDHLFESRYTPTNAHGKREVHTVYAKTKEKCETLLETMIAEVREQIKKEKQRMKV